MAIDELTHIINDAAIQLIQTNQAKLSFTTIKQRMVHIGSYLIESAAEDEKDD